MAIAESISHTLILIASLSVLIMLTRAVPFFFSRILQDNAAIKVLGKYLPAHILLLLVIHEANVSTFFAPPYGLPTFAGFITVIFCHVWKRQALLSVAAGTLIFTLINVYIHH